MVRKAMIPVLKCFSRPSPEQVCLPRLPSSFLCENKSGLFWEKTSANLRWFPLGPEQEASLLQSLLSSFSGCVLQHFIWNWTLKNHSFRLIAVFTDDGWTASEKNASILHPFASSWLWICDKLMIEMKFYESFALIRQLLALQNFKGVGAREKPFLCSYFT